MGITSVLCCCWLGGRKGIRPVKSWVMRCWRGYLSGAKCKWLAYGPADATATPLSRLQKIQNGLSFWHRSTQVVLEKRPLNDCVCVCVLIFGDNLFNIFSHLHGQTLLMTPNRIYWTWSHRHMSTLERRSIALVTYERPPIHPIPATTSTINLHFNDHFLDKPVLTNPHSVFFFHLLQMTIF